MKKQILAQPHVYDARQTETRLKQIEPELQFEVVKLVYYPYYFFSFTMDVKRFLLPSSEKVACTIDSISGTGSLIESPPQFQNINVPPEEIIPHQISILKARELSQSFLYRAISLKMKMLSISELTAEEEQIFYRPYWLAREKKNMDVPDFVIDAVSGKYHPLS